MNFFKARLAGKITIAGALILMSAFVFAENKKSPADRVASINGVVITQKEFDRELDINMQRFAASGRPIPEFQIKKLKSDVLDSLIEIELLYQESKKKGIQVTAEAISNQLMAFKQRFQGDVKFQKMLTENNLTESDFKERIQRREAIQQLIDKEVAQKVVITDEESKAYYDTNPQFFKKSEQVKASHILIKVDATASEAQKAEARKKIKEVQQKLQKGEDFATLAQNYSQGPSGPKGGDLGSFGRGQMVKPFEEAAFRLQPNEVSDIVETRFGYHLIKVLDKKPAEKLAYAEVKERLDERLRRQKVESEASLYIKNLKKDAKIEKF